VHHGTAHQAILAQTDPRGRSLHTPNRATPRGRELNATFLVLYPYIKAMETQLPSQEWHAFNWHWNAMNQK